MKKSHWIGWRLGLVVVCSLFLSGMFAGCGLSGVSGQDIVQSFQEALSLAQATAEAQYDQPRLVRVTAAWGGQDAKVDELEDNPGWGFQYVNADGTEQVVVKVRYDKVVTVSNPEALDTPITDTLSTPTEAQMSQQITAAVAHLGELPETHVLADEGPLDVVLSFGFNEDDGSEDAVVLFYQEANQATDWGEAWDWTDLLAGADAAVSLDAATATVEGDSWT